jgi:hypothetical protein
MIYHHETPQNPQNPLQNTISTTPEKSKTKVKASDE